MKKFTEFMAIFAAIFLVVSAASCKQEDESTSVTATFVSEEISEDGVTGYYSVVFYADETFVVSMSAKTEGVTVSADYAKGTYTGNPTEDGKITLTITHYAEPNEDGSLTMKEVGEEFELEAAIENGEATIAFGGEEIKFTRK